MKISLEQLKTFTQRFLRTLADNNITETSGLYNKIGECLMVRGSKDFLFLEFRSTPIGREVYVGYLLKRKKGVVSFRVDTSNKYTVIQTRCCVNIPGYKAERMDEHLNYEQTKRIDYFIDLSIIKGELEKILEV